MFTPSYAMIVGGGIICQEEHDKKVKPEYTILYCEVITDK
jgi:hypothetical protein